MRRSFDRARIISKGLTRALAGGLALACCALALPASALANNLFSLDPSPETAGSVVTEPSGYGYVAWLAKPAFGTEAARVMYCKIPPGGACTDPINLPLPAPGTEATETPSDAFPVIGTRPGVVYVVAPRYVQNDSIIWTSTDGGGSFSAPKKIPSYSNKTGPSDVLINPKRTATAGEPTADYFDISASNAGLGFSETGNLVKAAAAFSFEKPGGFVEASSMAFTPANFPVIAYWNLETPLELHYYINTATPADEAKNWEGPKLIKEAENPRLASGPAGLFMVSEDYLSGETLPATLEVRKYEEGSKSFGAPNPLSANVAQGLPPGIFENPDTGAIYIAWVALNGGGGRVIDLLESTDGGASFHGEREIAQVKSSFAGPPRLAAADSGAGWLTFADEGGLEVADLNPVVKVAPAPLLGPPTPTATTTATTQSGAGISGSSLTVPLGTPVTDQARIAGTHAATATGTVTYQLYKDSKCTKAFGSGSVAAVAAGAAGHSAAVKPVVGTYYWKAVYSGDAANSASTSSCGSEVLTVATEDTHLGLPSTKICLSRRKFIVHPRAPKGVKLVSVTVQINGRTVKTGRLSNRATSVSLVGLPKGTFKIGLITKSSKGKIYEDIRTFHTCVPGKHHKK